MTDLLASVTRFPGPYRVQADAILDVADTGERPLLVLASDGSDYWCKDFENRGNRETPINEIVSIEVGKAIGAPVCDWAIVDPPADMAGTRMGQTIVPRLPMFGSKEVKNVLLPENGIEYITKDDNFQRIPKLVALWLLCNAEDIQIMYAASEDHSIYSLDQGYWFGSHEMGRHFPEVFQPSGRPILPTIPRGIPAEYWEAAVESVNSLASFDFSHLLRVMPKEWNVASDEITQMVKYVKNRIEYTVGRLRYYQKNS